MLMYSFYLADLACPAVEDYCTSTVWLLEM